MSLVVRILHEGQYRLGGAALERLKVLDSQLVQALPSMDEAAFRQAYGEIVDLVRKEGSPVPEAEIVESDLILPAADTSLREAKALLTGTPSPS